MRQPPRLHPRARHRTGVRWVPISVILVTAGLVSITAPSPILAAPGTLLDVDGGIVATSLEVSGAITSAGSLCLDGTTDTITAASGSLSFADDNLSTTGTTSTGGLVISGLDCSALAGGGALTVDAGGVVSCSDDDTGTIEPDSLDFDDLADALTADATITIDLDSAGADLDVDGGTLFVDSSENRIGLGTPTPGAALDVVGDVHASGSISADGGLALGTGNLDQAPGTPAVVGSVDLFPIPYAVAVSGRFAYVLEPVSAELEVVDVSDPTAPIMIGAAALSGTPESFDVAGRYAYVLDFDTGHFQVVDLSNPSAPHRVGDVVIGGVPESLVVSGRYAYVADADSGELVVIDVTDPADPTPVGSLVVGAGSPKSVVVSGSHAYVGSSDPGLFSVIDVSDPSAPALVGLLGFGLDLDALAVSGRYAYVVDPDTDALTVVDVSDPASPTIAGSLTVGVAPTSVAVAGGLAYVASSGSAELQVVDVSDPTDPTLAASLTTGTTPRSVAVSGRYAYLVDQDPQTHKLKVIDVTGAELTSAVVHSLEAGSLQVRDDLSAQGQLRVTGGATIGAGGLFSDGDVGVAGTLALSADVAPVSSPDGTVQLFAEDVGGSTELEVRDEAGNVTTLSPHNFSLLGGPSEPLAWSYYSENAAGRINVDMLRTVRLVEQLSGERLVHARAPDGSAIPSPVDSGTSLRGEVDALRRESRDLEREHRRLEREVARIKTALGIE